MTKGKSSPSGKPAPEAWTVEFLDERVEAEFDEFSPTIQARMMRIYELIRDLGLPAVGKPYIDHVQGKLWELRAQDKDGWGRALYCTVTGRTVVILRCFSKKTNKTPRREINLALDRMREMR